MSPTQRYAHQNPDQVAKVAELIADTKVSMLTTTDPSGCFVSRPMAVLDLEFDGDLWLFTDVDARKVDHIRERPHVNVTCATADSWVSLDGHAEVVRDLDKNEELWRPVMSSWFPDGPASAGLALLRVSANGAEYWDIPGVAVASVLSFVKAHGAGKRYDGGENETVNL